LVRSGLWERLPGATIIAGDLVRLLVTGCRGQLGRALQQAAPSRGHEFFGYDLPELDITEPAVVQAAVTAVRPEVIVNCAAFTAVDEAEKQEAAALAVNGTAVTNVARAAESAGAVLLQVSTDYVFDGSADRPYRESDPPKPISVYGRTKLAGERAAELARRHLIVRTAWLFGDGANFVASIRRQLDAGTKQLRVVDDQRGCPTYTVDLAGALLGLLEAGTLGIVHAVNSGSATWFEFAKEIVRRTGHDAEVVPITTAEAGRAAPRPVTSVLDASELRRILGSDLPAWPDALARYLREAARETSRG
jgi:dTDP-4-dehydrorhamnose reductase